MKLEKLNSSDIELKKSEMSKINGGTSTTLYKQVGKMSGGTRKAIQEMEYEDTNGNGTLDSNETSGGTLVNLP